MIAWTTGYVINRLRNGMRFFRHKQPMTTPLGRRLRAAGYSTIWQYAEVRGFTDLNSFTQAIGFPSLAPVGFTDFVLACADLDHRWNEAFRIIAAIELNLSRNSYLTESPSPDWIVISPITSLSGYFKDEVPWAQQVITAMQLYLMTNRDAFSNSFSWNDQWLCEFVPSDTATNESRVEDKPEPSLDIPPFPRLYWRDSKWEGSIVLNEWAGFQSRRGAYGSLDSAKPATGSVSLQVKAMESAGTSRPTPSQASAFEWLRSHQEDTKRAILESLLEAYSGWRNDWKPFFQPAEFKRVMPEVKCLKNFESLIGLSNVHILATEKEGIAYVGYEFGCTWDSEHSLGFMTHQNRVVKVGGADISFTEWIAELDIRKSRR